MQPTQNTNANFTTRQLKLPLEIEKLIDISDPVYTFCEVMDHIDLTKYFVDDKDYKTGRPRCDAQKLLKVILQVDLERLKSYAEHIEICGENRNSYAKTDHDATFMRIKRDYMGNDQLLPAYNVQTAICDEYIAVIDAKPYASDQECFVPLMEKYMKFTMFEKETHLLSGCIKL